MAVSLGGLDGLVFTGGIGEHTAIIRERVCARLNWLGVELDRAANDADAADIAAACSQIGIRIIPTSEETTIARGCAGLLAGR